MFSDYEIKTTCSKSVYLVQHSASNKYFALKKIAVDGFAEEEFKQLCEEIKTIHHFNHPNIIKIHDVFVSNYNVNVIYPFFCFGSCKETMNNFLSTGFPEIIAALILRDLLLAVEYLHKKGIIHR